MRHSFGNNGDKKEITMAGMKEAISSVFSGSGTVIWTFGIMVIVGAIAIILALFGVSWWYFKKKWNLKVEIKLVRSDGKITIGEWGKGFFDAKNGVVHIRREGVWFGSTPMEIFDVKKYLQGDNLLTILQIGARDFIPILNHSWTEHVTEYENEETGQVKEIKESVLNIQSDSGSNKPWKSAFENSAKSAYSIRSFFTQFQTPIAIGIVILACFVGFAILWTRLGSLCG